MPGKKWGGIQNSTQTPGIIYIQSVKFPIPISHASTKFLNELYVKRKLPLEEVAIEFDVSRCSVAKELKSRGISIRNKGENIRRKRGLGYGQKIKNRKIEEHKRELKNIKRMKEMRESGMSFQKIAEIFNLMNIATKTRKGKWNSRLIYDLVKRES